MSTPQPLAPSLVPGESFSLEEACKQFSLETERLELTYSKLQERFQAVQTTLQDSHTRLSGKLAELDFVSRYLETILNHISQGILFIDLNGIVTTYNASAQEILQISEKELLFHPFVDFFDDSFLGFSLKEAFIAKKCPPFSFFTWNDKGRKKDLEAEATFVSMSEHSYPLAHREASSGPVQGLLVLLRDITKLRRLQQDANRHDRLKELGELAAHLAHEIRNPLGGIRGFASILEQELNDRADLKQMASHIVQGADDLNCFVSNVLAYARPFQFHLENINMIHFMDEIRLLMQADLAWNPKISLTIQCSLPFLVAPVDPQLFKSAILNLLVNAMQAMPDGGELHIILEADFSSVIVRIRDTGKGISQENLPKIFSPFFTTKESGNGLGLAEVQKVVQAHHGTIEVDSHESTGTEFTIKIPLKAGE